jgi:GT2 family glycosyltransferase
MLSVVIPTHNRCDDAVRLAKALDQQECSEPVEYIFVLDSCSDNTLQSLKALNLNNSFLVAEINECSVSAARNKGAELSSGEYLLFLDDDVMPQKGLIEAHLRFLRLNESKWYAYVGPCPFAPDVAKNPIGLVLEGWYDQHYKKLADPEHESVHSDCLTGNFSITKENFILVGGFNEIFRSVGGDDYEFGIRLHKKGIKIKYISDALAYHYPVITPKSHLKKSYSYGFADVYLANKYPEIFWSLPLWKCTSIGKKNRLYQMLIQTIGIDGFIDYVGRYFDGRIEKLWNKDFFAIFERIAWLIYRHSVLSELGGEVKLKRFISQWCDPKDLPAIRTKIDEIDISKIVKSINNVSHWDKINLILCNGDTRVGWMELNFDLNHGSISADEVRSAILEQNSFLDVQGGVKINGKIIYNHCQELNTDQIDYDKSLQILVPDSGDNDVCQMRSEINLPGLVSVNKIGKPLLIELKKALLSCQSELICFMNASDRLDKGFLKNVCGAFSDQEASALLCPSIKYEITTRGNELYNNLVNLKCIKEGLTYSFNDLASFSFLSNSFNLLAHRLVINKTALKSIINTCPPDLNETGDLLFNILFCLLSRSKKIVYDPLSIISCNSYLSRSEVKNMRMMHAFYTGKIMTGLGGSKKDGVSLETKDIIKILIKHCKKAMLILLGYSNWPRYYFADEVISILNGMVIGKFVFQGRAKQKYN